MLSLAVGLLLSALALGPSGDAFTAVAVNMGGRNLGATNKLDIVIDHWSTAAERDALAIADQESGPQAVTRQLRAGSRIGFVRLAGGVADDVTFARQIERSDGSRRVLIVLARVLAFPEVQRQSRTLDYPYTVIELRVDPSGSGEGTITVGTQVKFERGTDQIAIEKYNSASIVLKTVKATAP